MWFIFSAIMVLALCVVSQAFKPLPVLNNLKFMTVILTVFFTFSAPTQAANLQTILNSQIIQAAKHDSSLTRMEKLFERRCEMIEKYLGYRDNPMGHAMKYSCQEPQIGIAFYAGPDLGDYPPARIERVFLDRIGDEGLKAKVFTDLNHKKGSSVIFFINGETYLKDSVNPVKALEQVKYLVAEAKLIFISRHQVDVWPQEKIIN